MCSSLSCTLHPEGADPGVIHSKQRVVDIVRSWPDQTEIAVPGTHFLQEDSADEIGTAIASFVRKIRPG
ncbi:hypothetical protein Mkiyose1665_20100 [Mycobacterium kiyosense]|uniref:Haloalkane dehalogenase n=1 Tax=Mycobacterium kiyosense TaxID=2871094 RepID=A0A9P3Q6P6_9MYCO|nr:hypothetical protein IWGMT90018_00770 [Mycobacterium kiyosense]BDE11493.1 hypothetical protein MKCMC460_03530 [Mycobacterium sp. 20KCMC460]GLB82421.1 hypothetical protein SRL2020028_16770 [Mycobacterium kiyosense]GLB88872.1 hypothetical protein SRL2020130_16890 [Mycobacterium kiyosense]GLB95636.1 hypothetical protein SRL2020226_24120 [Mycobacterium kiyosense]